MKVIIVNNPKQKGAVDGAVAVFRALVDLKPDLNVETQVVNAVAEVSVKPDVICSVGPDTTDMALEIYNNFSGCIMVGMKDPFKSNPPAVYEKWRFIVDTMGTMKDSPVYQARPDLVYIPPFPPFTLTKKELEEAGKDPILEVFRPDIAVVIGGADPYTGYGITGKDMAVLSYIIDRIDLSYGRNVAFITSPRTPKGVEDDLKSWTTADSVAVFNIHEKMLYVGRNKKVACENFYKAALAAATMIIVTDDSLSVMAEATVAEKALLIYRTVLTDGYYTGVPALRRQEVCKNVVEMAGAAVLDWRITLDGEEPADLMYPKSKSLEGVVDKEIAERLIKAIF